MKRIFNKAKYYEEYIIKNRYSKNPFKKVKLKNMQAKIGCSFAWNVIINDRLIFSHGMNNINIAPFKFNGFTVIQQNVTIGDRLKQTKVGEAKGFLYIGSGAYISSDVTIGENVLIGANAVVTKDVPSNSIVINANQIKKNQSKKINEYKNWLESIFVNKRYTKGIKKQNGKISQQFVNKTNIIEEARTEADNAKTKKAYKEAKLKYKGVSRKYKNISNWMIWSILLKVFTFKKLS